MRRVLRWLVLTVLGIGLAVLPATASHDSGVQFLMLPAEHVKRLLDLGARLIFVDLRPAGEFAKGRLPGARSLPLLALRQRYAEIPQTGHVILYCACPPGEIQAVYQFLRDQGYRNISVMEEGFPGWVKRGYPVER